MLRCAFVLAAMVFLVAAGMPADPPEPLVPKESFRRAADADMAALQKSLGEIAAKPNPLKVRVQASTGAAQLLVRYADWLGDDALKSQALKVLRALAAEDWKAAAEAGNGLNAPKADMAILKAPPPKLTHAEVFAPFRASTGGGLNIDRDIREQTKANMPAARIDVQLAERIGVRTATLIELGAALPPVIGERKLPQREWDRFIYATNRAAREVAIEAAKGDMADRAKLKALLTTLHARCTDCHTTGGRDD